MNRTRRTIIGSIVPLGLLLWYVLSTSARPSPFFPQIGVMLQRFQDLWLFKRVMTDVVPSLSNFAIGYALAVVAGICIGTLLGSVAFLREMATPIINFGRSVPPLMIIPPLVLVLGIGDSSKIFVIALGAFFPIVLTTVDGLRQTDTALVDVSRAMRLGTLRTVRRVYIPSALPSIFGGAQTGLQIALILMVSTEMVAATRGVGYLTMQAQQTFNAPSVWAGILLLATLGFLINLAFTAVRNRVLAWHIGMRAASKAN